MSATPKRSRTTLLLKILYARCQRLRDQLHIDGKPDENLYDNGLGWDGDLDHELLVIADGLGGATLTLMDQGCVSHSKRFNSETEAFTLATRLHATAQGTDTDEHAEPLTIDDITWDT